MRQNFVAHNDEQDEDRVHEMIDKAYKDAEWVVKKVSSLGPCYCEM